jgi:hypothetical protein
MSSDTAKPHATALPRLDWQGELDSALADLDTRLTHPRRRATDTQRPPVLPELGHIQVTSEWLDEIAWRVAEQLRRTGDGAPATARSVLEALEQPPAASPPQPVPPPAAQTPPAFHPEATVPRPPLPPLRSETGETGLVPGKMLMIRYRMPALPWPFRLMQRRRRKQRSTARPRA